MFNVNNTYIRISGCIINVPLSQSGKSPEWVYVFNANPDTVQTEYNSNNDRWEGISYIDSYKYDKNNTSNKLEVSWNGISSSGDWEYEEHGGYVKVYIKVLGNAGQVILEQWESNKSLVISCHS